MSIDFICDIFYDLESTVESKPREAEISVEELFDSPPPIELHKWPLEWFYSRIRMGLNSHSWEKRHGATCAVRAILRKSDIVWKKSAPREKQQWLVDISVRLITLLALG